MRTPVNSVRSNNHLSPFLQKIRRFFGIFFGIVILILVMIFLGFLALSQRENKQKVIVFDYSLNDGSKNQKVIAIYDESIKKTVLYYLNDVGNHSGDDLLESEATEQWMTDHLLVSMQLELLVSNVYTVQYDGSTENDLSELRPIDRDEFVSRLRNQLKQQSVLSSEYWNTAWWWWHIRSLSSSDVVERSFSNLDEWLTYTPQRDFQLSNQPCSITIVNTTSVSGLATHVGKVIERSGLFVARLTNNITDTDSSLILTKSPDECTEVIEALQTITPGSGGVVVDEEAAIRYRARVVLLVGNDLATLQKALTD